MLLVRINRCLEEFFGGKWGQRRGNPMSPYLFVLCIEVLSQMLNSAAINDAIGYHQSCKKLKLTHLSFTDDLLIFSDASSNSILGIKHVLDEFRKMSRLRIIANVSSFVVVFLIRRN